MAFLTKYRLYMIGLALTLLIGSVIAVLTLAPVSSGEVPGSDKLHHFIAFAVLAFPLPFARPKLTLHVMLVVTAYGGLIELIQPYFGRDGAWGDFLADGLGAITGATMGAFSGSRFRKARLARKFGLPEPQK